MDFHESPGKGVEESATIVPLWRNHTLKCSLKLSLTRGGCSNGNSQFYNMCEHRFA